ncbi:MAG: ATP-binding protein, partial [Firmicutes bacterium]|nr:ATP-binding protein [Bacillota bacterium]
MIRILDKQIADKIAAGEVIERPVSIIKELVENSIDAGADSIVVEIKKGGKSYIRVTDNGCGIARDEVEKAFLRHATSKIETVKDLESIGTLGFRGEALASVCAVTRTELLTKRAEDKTGTRLIIHGGEIISN